MTDDELLTAFERGSLPVSEWNHQAHIRLAVSYLLRWSLDDAIHRIRSGIKLNNKRYGIEDGAERGYHETMTLAFMQLIHHRLHGSGVIRNSCEFCVRCPELLDRRVLLCYYTRDRIMQADAKNSFVAPDMTPLDHIGLVFPEFGSKIPGIEYLLRPGGYGIATSDDGRIAVVATPTGTYLPGGGQELGESATAALKREFLEECGLVVRVGDPVGVADEFVFAEEEQQHLCKRCSFYSAVVLAKQVPSEPDHTLHWLMPDEAIVQLNSSSQRWAMHQSMTRSYRI